VWFNLCRLFLRNHFLNLKTFRKVLLYFLLAFLVTVISLVISAFIFKERIISQFIQKANEQLSTPIKIKSIDVSVFERFPNISIVFRDVYVEDSHPGLYPLLTARYVSFHLHPMDVYRGQYIIQGLTISSSETNLKIDTKGINNFTITKESSGGGPIRFELKNVTLKNTRIRYVDASQEEDMEFSSEQLAASIQTADNRYTINAKGDVTTEKLLINKLSLLAGKSFNLTTSLVYDDVEKLLTLSTTEARLKNSVFKIQGTYGWKAIPVINMTIDGKDTDIQTLLTLLPENSTRHFTPYQSQGDMYFSAQINGEISDNKSPAISAEFGFTRATITHPETRSKIDDANLEGSFASSSFRNAALAVLSLKNIRGTLNGKPFQANLVIRNFTDSDILLNFKGEVDAAELVRFYPVENLKNVSGLLNADIAFEGRMSWLKNKANAQRASTRGSVDVRNVNFRYGKDEIPVQNLSGSFQFNNIDLALSDVTGKLGSSDFRLNGLFKNIITFLLFENQPVGIEADLNAKYLNVDELFTYAFGKDPGKGNERVYEFSIPSNLNLNFNCGVGRLQYKRFKAEALKGDLLVKNRVAVSRNINVKTMGGNLSLSGIIDAKNPKAIDISTSFKLNGLRVDSIFYVFENFQQTFIQDKHLKGNAFADVSLDMTLNQNLSLFQETLVADISATIRNGELNNFEPLKALNKYLDDEGLSALRFADLKNDIHIENKTVYIPLMEVRSNVTVLQISGTHTFDQRIDYRIITPLNSRRKIDVTESAGAIEEMDGRAKLFLKIIGTTDDYRVVYDTEAVKKKVIADLKKEVQELKDVFNKKKKKKEIELSAEEFDWDN
jgi:hypothetical protein